MKRIFAAVAAAVMATAAMTTVQAQTPPTPKALSVARFTPDGKLQKPADLTNWVFLGASLGMGYNPGSFNAARPGQFQIVLMEPTAYRHFVRDRQLRAGVDVPALLLRQRHAAALDQPERIHAGGAHQLRDPPDPTTDRARSPRVLHVRRQRERGHAPTARQCLRALPRRSRRVRGTFAQFYPTIRPLIPKEALERPRATTTSVRLVASRPVTEPSHPLDRPLPPDVAAGESAFIRFYQKYTVFSWPWAWRRTVLFGSHRRAGGHLLRRFAWPVRQGCRGRRCSCPWPAPPPTSCWWARGP